MATQVQFRGGTTSEHSTFTGVAREVTVDTTKKTVVVHDGSTVGGIPLAKESAVTSAAAITGGSINGTTVGASTASTGRFTTVTATGLTSGRVTYAGASGLLSDSSKLTFDTSNLTVGVTGLSANADGATGKLVLRKPNEASGNGQITRMLDFAPYYPGFDEAVVKASIFSGVDTGTQNGQIGFMTATGGVLSEKMRLLADGNLGIGTSSPAYKLDIKGGTGNQARFDNAGEQYTQIYWANNGTSKGAMWIDNTNSLFTMYGYTGMAVNFYTNATERMRIESSGNVGIGTGSTVSRLTVEPQSGSANTLTIRKTGVTSFASLGAYSDANGPAYFLGANLSFTSGGSASRPDTGYAAWNISMDSRTTNTAMLFEYYNTAGTYFERMRLDASGNLLVGTTSAFSASGISPKMTISNTAGLGLIAIGNTDAGLVTQPANNTNYYAGFFLNSSSTGVGNIFCTSSLTSYNTTSDYRLKTAISAVTGQGERIDSLKPIDYQWKTDNSQARGFLAHEFKTVYPNSVSGDKDAVDADGKPMYQSMQASTSEVIADLVAEIQSLRQRITTLENK